MDLGTITQANRTTTVTNDRAHLPLLIVGREHSVDTLSRLALDDVHTGRGIAYFGDAARILPFVPKSRGADTIVCEVSSERPFSFNIFHKAQNDAPGLAQYLLDAFAAVWESRITTTQFDRYMRLGAMATSSLKDGTLFSLPFLFTSEKHRGDAIGQIQDATLRTRLEAYGALSDREKEDRVLSLMNRMEPLLLDEAIRTIIGQKKTLPIKDTSILVVSLPKGHNYDLLAALVMSQWKGRSYIERPLVHVGPSIPIVACRYLSELQEQFRERMLGNATIMAFRTGGKDAKTLEPYFELYDQSVSLTRLSPWKAYVQLDDTILIDGYPHEYPADKKLPKKLRDRSATQYGVPKEVVEKRLDAFVTSLS